MEKEVPSPKDPNLCTREVESETTLAPDWMKIKEAFDSFNIPFPNNLFVSNSNKLLRISNDIRPNFNSRKKSKHSAALATRRMTMKTSASPCANPIVGQIAIAKNQINVYVEKVSTRKPAMISVSQIARSRPSQNTVAALVLRHGNVI